MSVCFDDTCDKTCVEIECKKRGLQLFLVVIKSQVLYVIIKRKQNIDTSYRYFNRIAKQLEKMLSFLN